MKVCSTRLPCCILGAALALCPSSAWAWTDTHVVSDDVRVEVSPDGNALVDHAITLRVGGGPLRSFDVVGVDVDAVPSDGGQVALPNEAPLPLDLQIRPDHVLRVGIRGPRGVSKGTFLFHVRYSKDFVAGGNIERDGAMLRVRWRGASWTEGLDGARCTFVFPKGATAPRAPSALPLEAARGEHQEAPSDPDMDQGVFLSQVRGSALQDELELVRPHAARGEAVQWIARVDPKALGDIRDERLMPRTPVHEPVEQSRSALGYVLLGLFSALLYAGLGARKSAYVAAIFASSGKTSPPLLPAFGRLRPLLSGSLLAVGVTMQMRNEDPLWGTLGVLFAMALTVHLPPSAAARMRGPGVWLPLADRDALPATPRRPGFWMDASTRQGKLALLGAIALGIAVACLAYRSSYYHGILLSLDCAALVPLWATLGVREHLDPLARTRPLLARLAPRLRARKDVKVVAWGRLPRGQDEFDEVRWLVLPRAARKGLLGIEVGYYKLEGGGPSLMLPEILLRVTDGTPCHQHLSSKLMGRRWVRGRKPEERVLALRPRLPTARMTCDLVHRLSSWVSEEAPSSCAESAAVARHGETASPRRVVSKIRGTPAIAG